MDFAPIIMPFLLSIRIASNAHILWVVSNGIHIGQLALMICIWKLSFGGKLLRIPSLLLVTEMWKTYNMTFFNRTAKAANVSNLIVTSRGKMNISCPLLKQQWVRCQEVLPFIGIKVIDIVYYILVTPPIDYIGQAYSSRSFIVRDKPL